MPNRLKDSASPYLLQHADNPVDWQPWGEEAFDEARERDVPIFLSVGYSSCHWCHVMAHESFEDEDVAARLNEGFVPVKVDREERPDVDAVYMEATTALTGRGGWPMSVFLTPDGRPFVAGTYWPKEDRGGTPGFFTVLEAVRDAWETKREDITASAGRIAAAIDERTRTAADGAAEPEVVELAGPRALGQWDRRLGGFGQAPKFPQAMTIEWLLHRHLRLADPDAVGDPERDENLAAVVHSLDAMARGGIHDQIGGGFHRYSTDARWLVPHFEKMLYDNALLAPVYAQAAAVTGDARFDRVARSTCDYLLREMRDPAGGFHSATDADVEGEEGVFFVWTHAGFAEAVRSVGADVDRFAAFLGVNPGGNWVEEATREQQETNILHEPVDRATFCAERGIDLAAFEEELEAVRSALYERREQRTHPGLDDKVLTSWNALAVRGLALTGAYLGLPEYVAAATQTATFLHDELVVDGRLRHVWKDGQATIGAFLEDVAYLAIACLDLYAVTADPVWYQRAVSHAEDALERFRDVDGGGFFATADDAEELYTRPKDSWDNATPSGNSVMAEVATRLHGYTAEPRWRDLADEIVAGFQDGAERAPVGYGWLLRTCEHLLAGPREVAIVGRPGRERDALVDELWRRPRPGTVISVAEPDGAPTIPLLEGRDEVDGVPAAYVCRDHVCERPVTSPQELADLLAVPSAAP